jgi:hypothetical protein
MSSLSTQLRRQLENTIKEARTIAERGSRKALEALAVHEPEPYRHMEDAQKDLRRRLRAQAKQLGDRESQSRRGAYEIARLIEKLAYDQWHRVLFARFLLENNLLLSPEHGVSVSLEDCEELAPALRLKDAWAVAARFAAAELPQIFRAEDPAGAVDLPVEDRNPLIRLVTGLPVDVFTASDSLGWCYQFWQSERRDAVNAAGNKIGADELPAVTQLFTEDYMVDFLLDNTLGAWHAGKVLASNPMLGENPRSEEEVRAAVALPTCSWRYLRFVKDANGRWTPAAGHFGGWPKSAKHIKCLDPCMGSGHFVVAMFERLVALRVAEEGLDEAATVSAVVEDNLFGLEIDPRCTQIAAFNLALTAWRRVGHCKLPPMNLACCGVAPNAKLEEWLKLAGDNSRLRHGMERLHGLFKDAPNLGSLINPRATGGDLVEAEFHELEPLLVKALAKERGEDNAYEMAVAAQGLAKAAEILAGEFTLVATNVPYLGYREMSISLMEHVATCFPAEKGDLGYCLWRRFHSFVAPGKTIGLVTLQHWLSLRSYVQLRRQLLANFALPIIAHLGTGAFATISGEKVNVVLTLATRSANAMKSSIALIDAASADAPQDKARSLIDAAISNTSQDKQYANPDHRISFGVLADLPRLSVYADCLAGIMNGDSPRFIRKFWELPQKTELWAFLQSTVSLGTAIGGLEQIILFDEANGHLREEAGVRRTKLHNADERGNSVWGRSGVAISQMSSLPASRYFGNKYDSNIAAIVPKRTEHLTAIWAFCSSESFHEAVRAIDRKLNVTNATFGKVPFDLAHWGRVAAEKYPHGLPKPVSSDPTQWLFNGHPKGSDQPLHVAVARLMGYQWPRQTGASFPDCSALGADGVEESVDSDGIICISSTTGHAPAAERLRELVARAWGRDWNANVFESLLAEVGCAGRTLEEWLRNEFFEQHCALFHQRPFIWHIWDGHRSGFSALVNYHRLTRSNLEKLTYAYLGDWLRRQQAALEAGEHGSDARLEAAKQLQSRLRQILEGEPPYDIFVRWKPLSKQALGWDPDVNDGVRVNIRPFAMADTLRKRVTVKWDKDRGKEAYRDKWEFPWFWGWDGKAEDFAGAGKQPDGKRWNACHYTNEFKKRARQVTT